MLKLPPYSFRGLYNLNLTLAPDQCQGGILQPLVESFFHRGGKELQINVLDLAKLEKAMEDPQLAADMVVRIAGLNARFIDLSQRERFEILERA